MSGTATRGKASTTMGENTATVSNQWVLPRPRDRGVPTGLDGYRGPDRRARPKVDGPPPAALGGAALVLGALIPLGWLRSPAWLDAEVVSTTAMVVDAMAIGFALLVVVVLRQRAQLGGDGWARRMATIMLVLALAVLAFELTARSASLGVTVPTAGRVVVLVAAIELLVASAVDTARRAWWPHVVVGLVAVGALATTSELLAPVTRLVAAGSGVLARPALAVTGAGALIVALVAFAVAVRRDDHRARWAALLFVALATSDFALAGESEAESLSIAVAGTIRLAGVVILLYVSVVDLRNVALIEREHGVEARLEASRATDRLVHHVRRQEEVVHDARNALLAIDGGLASVEGESSPTMVAALRSEVHRLAQVLEDEKRDARQPFSVVELLEPMVLLYQSAHLPVTMLSDTHPWATGDPAGLVEIIQNLVDNALRHAADSPVTIWVVPAGDEVMIRVADRGRGIPAADRASVFDRGVASTDSGLGLSVARDLARAQGGSIEVDERDGGGALLSVRLPRFDVDQGTRGDRGDR